MFHVRGGMLHIGSDANDAMPRELLELDYHEKEANTRPSVLVAIRCRPMISQEDVAASVVNVVNNNTVLLNMKPVVLTYRFNNVFIEDSQHKVFSRCGQDAVNQILSGFNSCIIAYGASGSGKLD